MGKCIEMDSKLLQSICEGCDHYITVTRGEAGVTRTVRECDIDTTPQLMICCNSHTED